jgi:hypothetical protein
MQALMSFMRAVAISQCFVPFKKMLLLVLLKMVRILLFLMSSVQAARPMALLNPTVMTANNACKTIALKARGSAQKNAKSARPR